MACMHATNSQPLYTKGEVDLKMTVRFKCKDFLLKDCTFEVKGVRSADEMMKLVDAHVLEAHRTLRISPETREKIRQSMKR